MRLKKTLIVLLLTAQSLPAFAGHGHDHPGRDRLHDERAGLQHAFKHGLKSGALTRQEADILRQEQRELRQLERELSEDHRLMRWERRYLSERYAELGKHVRHLANNDHYRQRYPRNKSHEQHDDHGDDEYDYSSHKVNSDEDILLWASLGIMGVVLVDQLNQ